MPKLVTVSRDPAGRYWASFAVEEAPRQAPEPFRTSIGIDAGARRQIARLHARAANCRREHLHRTSTSLVNESQVIGIETLAVKEMTQSHRGTVESPGKDVKKRSRINRALLDASMGELLRQIRYKGAWYARTVSPVAKDFPSSQLCSACGHLHGRPSTRRLRLDLPRV